MVRLVAPIRYGLQIFILPIRVQFRRIFQVCVVDWLLDISCFWHLTLKIQLYMLMNIEKNTKRWSTANQLQCFSYSYCNSCYFRQYWPEIDLCQIQDNGSVMIQKRSQRCSTTAAYLQVSLSIPVNFCWIIFNRIGPLKFGLARISSKIWT
jgi:hypothetical protein